MCKRDVKRYNSKHTEVDDKCGRPQIVLSGNKVKEEKEDSIK